MINQDTPVDGSKEKPDLFHREPFAKRIADKLMLPAGARSLVASLEGEWGSGKTSVVEMMCRHLEEKPEKERPIIIRFNPWIFSGSENLTREFLVQLGTSLKLGEGVKSALHKAGDQVLRYSKIFDVAKFIPGAEPLASLISSVSKATGSAAKAIGSAEEMNLEEQRNRVEAALKKVNKPFLVVIDDLDRLTPDEIYAMLKLVKTVSDFPRVAYLLCYEHAHIVDSLGKSRIPDPSAYLEKIVQLRLSMPRTSMADATDFFNSMMKAYGSSEENKRFPEEIERMETSAFRYISPLIKSPRDLIRLSNRLAFHYEFVNGEVSFADYCALETLAVVESRIYDHIKKNPECYVGHDPQNILSFHPDAARRAHEERDRILQGIGDSGKRVIISELIDWLFPKIAKNGDKYSYKSTGYGRTSGRIAEPDNFEYAFYFSRPHHLVSLNDLRSLWFDPINRSEIFKRMATVSRVKKLLNAINELINTDRQNVVSQEWGVPENPIHFLQCCAPLMDSPSLPRHVGGMFFMDFDDYFKNFIYSLLKRTQLDERNNLAENVVGDKTTLPFAWAIVFRNIFFRDKKDSDFSEKKPLFPKEEADKLNCKFKEVAIAALSEGILWRSKFLRNIITTLLHLQTEDEIVKAYCSQTVSPLDQFYSLSALLGMGSLNAEPYYKADMEFKFSKLPIDVFQKKALALEPLEEISANEFKAFKKAYSSPGEAYYLTNAQKADLHGLA